MYRFKRLLVGLNINDQDSKLIRYASLVSHYQHFIKNIDLRNLTAMPDFVLGTDIPHAILDAVHEQEAALLVLGSRGRTDSAAVLLGSVTEKMIRTTDVPIVAVKKKGANLTFLDALLQL